MVTVRVDSVPQLRRSRPVVTQRQLHLAKRVAEEIEDDLLNATKVGYSLTIEEQYLLALASRMHGLISRCRWTTQYRLRLRKNGVTAA